jgi:predicted choloylglycine hydrolase
VWPSYQQWFQLRSDPVEVSMGAIQLAEHMPELVPTYEAFCHGLGADAEMAAFLSLYNPPAFRAGCSQAVWSRTSPSLIRNYDFPAHMCDRQLLWSRWNHTRVIAMTDCLWGVLDGMNEHGLALSLAYGGREKRGDGFSITLVLRYILEFCKRTSEAVAVLERVPIHMPYNVTLLDSTDDVRTVEVCPQESLQVSQIPFATNHQAQGNPEFPDATADSILRESFIATRLADPAQREDELLAMFLGEPLLRKASQWHGWGTLYTARYSPGSGSVELHWPGGQVMHQSFDGFEAGGIEVSSPGFT